MIPRKSLLIQGLVAIPIFAQSNAMEDAYQYIKSHGHLTSLKNMPFNELPKGHELTEITGGKFKVTRNFLNTYHLKYLEIYKQPLETYRGSWTGSTNNSGYASGKGKLTLVNNTGWSPITWTFEGECVNGTFQGEVKATLQNEALKTYWWLGDVKRTHDEHIKFMTESVEVLKNLNNCIISDDYSMLWSHREKLVDMAQSDQLYVYVGNRRIGSHLRAKGIDFEAKINNGKIGERFVPEISNERASSETLYYIGDTPVTRNRSYAQTEGGYSEDRQGYTYVFRLTNNTANDVAVDLAFIGRSTYFEQIAASTGFWIFKENVHQTQTNKKDFFIRKPILIKAGETFKDQIILGESYAGLNIFPVFVSSVNKNVSNDLESFLFASFKTRSEAKIRLSKLEMLYKNKSITPWMTNISNAINETKAAIDNFNFKEMSGWIKTNIIYPNNFDQEFSNKITYQLRNTSLYPLKIKFTNPLGENATIDLKPGKSIDHIFQVTGKSKNEISSGFVLKEITSDADIQFRDAASTKPSKNTKGTQKSK